MSYQIQIFTIGLRDRIEDKVLLHFDLLAKYIFIISESNNFRIEEINLIFCNRSFSVFIKFFNCLEKIYLIGWRSHFWGLIAKNYRNY